MAFPDSFGVAPVKQLIMEKLPAESRIHSSSKELISELSMLFLNQLSSIANDVCSEQEKKTICPDHVLDAIIVSKHENENEL